MNCWLSTRPKSLRLVDIVLAALVAAVVSIPTRAADSLADARDLYAAAEYEDALALLNKLQPGEHPADERRAIEQYRAYCLLALGRSADAEQAIAAVVNATPLYKPSGSDVSPRVRSAFTDVRRRVLPSIIQEKYAAAKVAFDRKNFPVAAAAFTEVVEAMADPDVTDVVKQPPLSDLRVLAIGFRDLSVTAAAPPPVPVRETAPAAPAALVTPAPAAAVAPPRIYVASDTTVLPPTAIKQQLPAFPSQLAVANRGVLELVINEEGDVESVAMRESVNPRYDSQLLAAAKAWQYRPALLNGKPVKYRKLVQIDVKR
ncbi:MAG TPA: energy transducer TonB [Vicinamibacterales bacterium]